MCYFLWELYTVLIIFCDSRFYTLFKKSEKYLKVNGMINGQTDVGERYLEVLKLPRHFKPDLKDCNTMCDIHVCIKFLCV